MIDHTGVIVSDLDKSKRFYTAALGPIGYKLIHDFPASVTGTSMAWTQQSSIRSNGSHRFKRFERLEQLERFEPKSKVPRSTRNSKHQTRNRDHAHFAAETIISTRVPGVRTAPTAARAGKFDRSTHAIQASFISSFRLASAM